MPDPVSDPLPIARYSKLVGAIASMVLGWIVLKLGLDLDADLAAAITGLITAVAVERLRNVM